MPQRDDPGTELARGALHDGLTIAVAESLTGGSLAARLAQLPDASRWFRGSIVAYSGHVKHDLLGVPDVPVVSEPSARAMAEGAARLLHADLVIAVTGEAGPEPQDDVPVGTVWMAITDGGQTTARSVHFDGEPGDIVRSTCGAAVGWLAEHVLNRVRAR